MLGTVQPTTQCHCPEDLYLQQQQMKTSKLSQESPWAKMAEMPISSVTEQ